jgi:hypothetical protein
MLFCKPAWLGCPQTHPRERGVFGVETLQGLGLTVIIKRLCLMDVSFMKQ